MRVIASRRRRSRFSHSASFAHRTLSTSKFRPSDNGVWVGACVLVFCVNCAIAIVRLGMQQMLLVVSCAPWYTYLLGLAMLVLARFADMLVKQHDRKLFERTNRLMYLEFTTKLGMHSPIMPGHRTPRSFLDESQTSFTQRGSCGNPC